MGRAPIQLAVVSLARYTLYLICQPNGFLSSYQLGKCLKKPIISSHGSQGHIALLSVQSLPPTAHAGSLFPEYDHQMVLHGVECPPPGCENMWLITAVNLFCPVLCVMYVVILCYLGGESILSSVGKKVQSEYLLFSTANWEQPSMSFPIIPYVCPWLFHNNVCFCCRCSVSFGR